MGVWRQKYALLLILSFGLTASQGCTEKSEKRKASHPTKSDSPKDNDSASTTKDSTNGNNNIIADLSSRKSDPATGCLVPASADDFPIVTLGATKTGWDGTSPLTSARFNVIAVE